MTTAAQTWIILGGFAALQTVWITRSLLRVEQRLARLEERVARD